MSKRRQKAIRQQKTNNAKRDSQPAATASSALPGPATSGKLKTWMGLIVAAFAFILYVQSISFDYTLDDHPAIDLNKYTKQGFAGIPTLIKTDYWYGFKDELRGPVYRPTSLVMFAVEWQLFPENPAVNHFMNVLLYAITCWVLFLVLCRFSLPPPFRKLPQMGLLFPFICSLLYAAHPIHTEVVNNIKSRDEINCFLFGILSIFFFLKSVSNKSILNLTLGAVCFFLALLSKETGVTFLLIIPLVLFTFTEATKKVLIRSSLLLLSITALYFIIRTLVLKSVPDSPHLESSINNTLYAAPDFMSRQATTFYILLKYIQLLIFPHPLTCDYNFSQIKILTLNSPVAMLGIISYFVLGIYAIIKIRKKNIIAFAILFYLLTLSPVSNVFFLGGSSMAERFMYMPSLGFCIILGWLISRFIKNYQEKKTPLKIEKSNQVFSNNKFVFFIIFLILGLYSIKTISRSKDWKDQLTIYSHDVKISDNSATAHYLFGSALLTDLYPKEKNETQKSIILDESIEEINRAISIFNEAPIYYLKLGQAYVNKHDNKNAIKNFEKYLQAPNAEGSTYMTLGGLYIEEKQYDKAIEIFESAIEKDSNSAEGYYNKGTALLKSKRYLEAVPLFQKAMDKRPSFVDAYCNMGCSLASLNKLHEAMDYFQKGILLDSTYAKNFYFMGLTYQNMGDTINSKIYFAKFARLTGGK